MPAETVLLVDDNADSRTICATILRHHGYAVLEADNGLEGVRRAQDDRPDVIVMDVGLPLLDGWAALERIRAHPSAAGTPVLMYTARTMQADHDRARQLGCAGYIVKPCFPSEVLAQVRRALGERGGAAQSPGPDASPPPST